MGLTRTRPALSRLQGFKASPVSRIRVCASEDSAPPANYLIHPCLYSRKRRRVVAFSLVLPRLTSYLMLCLTGYRYLRLATTQMTRARRPISYFSPRTLLSAYSSPHLFPVIRIPFHISVVLAPLLSAHQDRRILRESFPRIQRCLTHKLPTTLSA